MLRAVVCRKALCKDSNYQPLLGLIWLPSLDVLAQEGRTGRGGGEDGLQLLDITPRTLGSKGAVFSQTKLDLTNKLWLIFVARQ